jgi:hypothetical protein
MGYVIFAGIIFCIVFGAGASLTNNPKSMAKGNAERLKRVTVVALVISIIAGVGIRLAATQTLTFKSNVTNFSVLPDNYVRVFLTVTNTGNTAGSPSCQVNIQPVNAYGDQLSGSGFDAMSGGQKIQPGASYSGYMDIVVSDNDAQFVTSKSMITVSNC